MIRKEIRNAYTRNLGHYTVFLPAYHEEKLVKFFSAFKDIQWHIFSGHCQRSYGKNNCWIRPVNNYDFTDSFINCEGIITGGGFGIPAEAMFMGKKLLVIPGNRQYEQHSNIAALATFGVPVIKSLRKKNFQKIGNWLVQKQDLKLNFTDEADTMPDRLMNHGLPGSKAAAKELISHPAISDLPSMQID